jgi:hypothetical protein
MLMKRPVESHLDLLFKCHAFAAITYELRQNKQKLFALSSKADKPSKVYKVEGLPAGAVISGERLIEILNQKVD